MLNLHQQTPIRQFQGGFDSWITQETFQETFKTTVWNTITLTSIYKKTYQNSKILFQIPKTSICSRWKTERSLDSVTFSWSYKPSN